MSQRDYEQIVSELQLNGERFRSIEPREMQRASGLVELVYTAAQRRELRRLDRERAQLHAAQRALLRHPGA